MDQELLYRFFEGVISRPEEELIRQWMEASPENQAAFLKESHLHDAMILLGSAGYERTGSRFRRIAFRWLKVAAAIFIILCVTYLFTISGEDTRPMYTVTAPAGQRVNIGLPDGTNLWLNARTTLQYASSFDRKERRVFLDGEAYFEVARNGRNRFIVETPKGEVEVIGTRFNVEAYSDSEVFETSLLEGSVDVRTKGDPSYIIHLNPHQKAIWRDGKIEVEVIADYNKFSWRDGLISFRNMSFADIIKEIEKCYGVKIELHNERITGHILSGKFRHTDGIDYILRVLQRDVSFNYSRDDEQNIYYIQ